MKNKRFVIVMCILFACALSGCANGDKIKTVDIEDANVGDFIEYGAYEQDNDKENGSEDILWRVIAKEDNRILVISDKALKCKPHLLQEGGVQWESSEIRTWLNEDFLNSAFDEEERAAIPETKLTNADNPLCGEDGGSDTTDRIFLLSYDEVKEYMESEESRICYATEAAKGEDVYVASSNGATWWWLRSQGYSKNRMMRVSASGVISEVGEANNSQLLGVRPTMWIEY